MWTQGRTEHILCQRLRKLKSGVQYYAANYINYINDQSLITTPKEWKLVTQIIQLLEPFFAAKQCRKLPQGQENSVNQEKSRKIKKMTKVKKKSGKDGGF